MDGRRHMKINKITHSLIKEIDYWIEDIDEEIKRVDEILKQLKKRELDERNRSH